MTDNDNSKEIFVHIDAGEQTVPEMDPNSDLCPNCGTLCEMGFGLAGGGYGPYLFCPNCMEVVAKTQVED